MTSEGDPDLPGAPQGSGDVPQAVSVDDALNQVRSAMSAATGLFPVAEAAAVAICSLMSAWETTVTLIDGAEYWDIVDVRHGTGFETLFPDLRYPLSSYQIGTARVLAGKGFFTSDPTDPVMVEYARQFPEIPVGSMMSVPIVALDEVHGEIFLVRPPGTVAFGRNDLDVCLELATPFGARLPALVTAYYEQHGEGSGSPSLPDLTRELDDPLE